MTILLTGAAGFIGFHTALKFLKQKHSVIGIDNLNDYYDTKLKYNRLNQLKKYKKFTFLKKDIQDKSLLKTLKKIKLPLL